MNTSTAAYLSEICKNYDASTYEHCKRHPTLVPLILEYIQNTMNAGDIKYAAKLTVISRIYSPEQEIMNDTPKKEHPAELTWLLDHLAHWLDRRDTAKRADLIGAYDTLRELQKQGRLTEFEYHVAKEAYKLYKSTK